MTPKQAFDIADVAAAELLPQLAAAKKSDRMPVHRRDVLERVRNRLHRACLLFERGDDAERFEQWYLPLFDALGFVNNAINLPASVDLFIDRAAEMLHAVRQGATTYSVENSAAAE